MTCRHWEDIGLRSGGKCALGLFGGRPSFGVCVKSCTRRAPGGTVDLLERMHEAAHPSGMEPISGCCDRVD